MPNQALILGDGQMALVMADALAERGGGVQGGEHGKVRMWGPIAADANKLAASRRSPRLPGFQLPKSVEVTAKDDAAFDVDGAAAGAPLMIISAIPTQYLRNVWTRLRPHVPDGASIVSVTKGIEVGSLLRPTQVIAEVLGKFDNSTIRQVETKSQKAQVSSRPMRHGVVSDERSAVGKRMSADSREPRADSHSLCALSGPSIAAEMARRLPASLVAASDDCACAEMVQDMLRVPWLRIYRHDDVIGVEVAGAAKNVIALAAGMVDGLGAGDNAKSALLARGLAEIARLGVAMGAKIDTFFGIAGVGDLATTCFSPEGRNRSCGERLAKGESLDAVLASSQSVVEGVPSTRSVMELARAHNVDMPITEAVHAILFEGMTPRDAIKELMKRELKAEHVG